MKIALLRRRRLGNTSCREISKNSNHNIEVIRNDKIPTTKYDLLIRWGTTSQFASTNTLNKTESIHLANNKRKSRTVMIESGVSCPKMGSQAGFPCIVRPEHHSQGRRLYMCKNQSELNTAVAKINKLGKQHYISEYIAKDEEWGVFVFQGRVTSMIKKVPKTQEAKNAIAWNVAQGTHAFENVNWDNWNIPVAIEGVKAMECIGLDFGRVDIIVKDGVPYVLEVNSAHSLTSEYRQQTFAKCLDYYIEKGAPQNKLELDKVKSFRSIIHPALRVNDKAINL